MEENSTPEGLSSTTMFGALNATGEEMVDTTSLNAAAVDTIQDLPVGSALLVVTRGPNVNARYLLKSAQTTVGRSTSADIFLDDVTVSRKHAVFYALSDGNGYGVRDTGSLNGTYVNRERNDDAVLKTGDEVQIGKYRMVYYASPQVNISGENQ